LYTFDWVKASCRNAGATHFLKCVAPGVKTVSSGQVAEQYKDYEALLSQLGPEATDEQVEKYLSERERVEPAADLEREAVMRLKEKVMQARQIALR